MSWVFDNERQMPRERERQSDRERQTEEKSARQNVSKCDLKYFKQKSSSSDKYVNKRRIKNKIFKSVSCFITHSILIAILIDFCKILIN